MALDFPWHGQHHFFEQLGEKLFQNRKAGKPLLPPNWKKSVMKSSNTGFWAGLGLHLHWR